MSIVKGLFKELSRLLAFYLNLFCQKICPSSISYFLTWAMDRKVRPMDFFTCHPLNILFIKTVVPNCLYYFITSWQLNWWILFEDKSFCNLLFLLEILLLSVLVFLIHWDIALRRYQLIYKIYNYSFIIYSWNILNTDFYFYLLINKVKLIFNSSKKS